MFGAPQPRFRIYTRPQSYGAALGDLLSGRLTCGVDVSELEALLAGRVGVEHAICTPTARTGIYLTLASLIQPGQKVILSPLTIVDVINMVLCAGGRPVFADVEPHTCNIDPADIERLIDDQTGAVLITHLHGLACDVERIRKICDQHKVPLVEDAAQAFSTHINDQWMGSFGRAGIFSFGLYKNVNAFFGGAICTSDGALAAKIRQRIETWPFMTPAQLGKKVLFGLATDVSTMVPFFPLFTYWVFRYGYLHDVAAINNKVIVDLHPTRIDTMPASLQCRMTPFQARLIRGQLDRVEKNNQKRIQAATLYHEGLSDVPDVILPPKRVDGSHIYTYFPFRVPNRHDLNRFAMQNNRDFVLSHYRNCASLDIFREFYRECPEAQGTSQQLIYLPTYPRYKKNQIEKNIEVIRRYFKKKAPSAAAVSR